MMYFSIYLLIGVVVATIYYGAIKDFAKDQVRELPFSENFIIIVCVCCQLFFYPLFFFEEMRAYLKDKTQAKKP